LKTLEIFYRKTVLDKVEKGESGIVLKEECDSDSESKLPFSMIYKYVKDRQEELQNLRYQLRSGKAEGKFLDEIKH